ncbi:hypothetical protein BED47_18100 [Gottfriedia luciferensis]|uniref:DUF1254 domain-containing protein n=1 Tax=Gottfriedia luciferensis TaxID=178774 RepID=A0ABX2ZWR3_9BACI|nr:DUF1254 domain-containing protein [Gottfriedia luciferensis]ODG92829.1 hypothetical protein BED47_18100 [Gottfriedia luciferensis]
MSKRKLIHASTVLALFLSFGSVMSFASAKTNDSIKRETKNTVISTKLSVKANTDITSPEENLGYSLGTQAFIYGYPLLTLERTKQLRATTQSKDWLLLNKFRYSETLATADEKSAMAPNNDTLYYDAWLNLSKYPVMINVPDTNDRYYSIQLVDAWDNTFNYIGRRTTGTKVGHFAIVSPNWKGALPEGVTKIQAPTDHVWALGRIFVKNDDDLAEAVNLEKKFTITKLNGKDPIFKERRKDLLTSSKVEALSAKEFLRLMNENILKNMPSQEENTLLDQFKEIGIDSTVKDSLKNISQDTLNGVDRAIKDSMDIIKYKTQQRAYTKDWRFSFDGGVYGHNYLLRSVIAYNGTVANIPEEALYSSTLVDSTNTQLNGKNKYVLHFDKGRLPDVQAFWSLTMYGTDFFLVKNPINRYKIGNFSNEIKYNPDGSLDIYIQHDSPKGKEANWLPAPEGDFKLIMRFYQPSFNVLNGSYKMPSVQKID